MECQGDGNCKEGVTELGADMKHGVVETAAKPMEWLRCQENGGSDTLLNVVI